MNKQYFINDIKLPSLNEVINISKKHWSCYRDLKDDLQNYICWKIKQFKLKPVKKIKLLEIIWIEPNTRRDKDNIVAGGKKFIIDSLVSMKIIKDDGWNYIFELKDSFKVGNTYSQEVILHF